MTQTTTTNSHGDALKLFATLNPIPTSLQDSFDEAARERTLALIRSRRHEALPRDRGRSRKRAVAALVLVVALAVPALAVSGALDAFIGGAAPPQPTPISGKRLVVATGHWSGVPWRLIAYLSNPVTPPNVTTTLPHPWACISLRLNTERTGSLSCGPLNGLSTGLTSPDGNWLVTLAGEGGPNGTHPGWIIGAASSAVSNVEILAATGATVRVPLLRTQRTPSARIGFFAIPVRNVDLFKALIARDASGKVLERVPLLLSRGRPHK
jgi:hypothetical protein